MTTGDSGKQYVRRTREQDRKATQPAREKSVREETIREERAGDAAPLADQYQHLPEQPEGLGGPLIAFADLAYDRASKQTDPLLATEPQIIQDIVDMVKADLHKVMSNLLGPHQELLFRFNRTQGGTYQARFSNSDHWLTGALELAQQEGFIRRTTDGGQIVGFTTAKGSTYELKGNATKRFKKVKSQQYGFSKQTVYITKEVAFRLPRLIRSSGVPEIRNGELWVDFAKARGRGLDYPDEKIPSTDTPTKGLHPFEELPRKEGHRNWHIGNEIIELDTGGSIVGYSYFQLTSRGLSELRRLEQQLVDRLAANSDMPGVLGLAVQVLEQGTQVRDILAKMAQAAIETEEQRLGGLTDTERHAIYMDYLDKLGQEMADHVESVVNDLR